MAPQLALHRGFGTRCSSCCPAARDADRCHICCCCCCCRRRRCCCCCRCCPVPHLERSRRCRPHLRHCRRSSPTQTRRMQWMRQRLSYPPIRWTQSRRCQPQPPWRTGRRRRSFALPATPGLHRLCCGPCCRASSLRGPQSITQRTSSSTPRLWMDGCLLKSIFLLEMIQCRQLKSALLVCYLKWQVQNRADLSDRLASHPLCQMSHQGCACPGVHRL